MLESRGGNAAVYVRRAGEGSPDGKDRPRTIPERLRERRKRSHETPFSITFTGRLYGETELLALGHAYQQATGFHLRRPAMENVTPEIAGG